MADTKLASLRTKIDQIDEKVLKLLNQRAKTALQIGQAKRVGKKATYAPEREKKLLARLAKNNSGPFPGPALQNVYGEILSACRSLQSPLNVAYLGPEATFTQAAAFKHFGRSTEMQAQGSINGVFEAVEADAVEYGVVPIENSTEGVVTRTVDRLMGSPLHICGEILLGVHHCLLGRKQGITPEQIYSHPQAIAQCRGWLERHYPNVSCFDVSSTARAAQLVSQDDKSYAIGSELSAEHYGLKVLHKNIEDHHHNITRFLVLGKQYPKRSGDDKTSLVFSVRDDIGVLFKMLEPFHQAGINLSKIESRPMMRLHANKVKARDKTQNWEYAFFIDLEGHIDAPKVSKAIGQLEQKCLFLKILGSYPKGK